MLPNWSSSHRVSTACLNLLAIVYVFRSSPSSGTLLCGTSMSVISSSSSSGTLPSSSRFFTRFTFLRCVPPCGALSKTSFPVHPTTSNGFVSKAGESLFGDEIWIKIFIRFDLYLFFNRYFVMTYKTKVVEYEEFFPIIKRGSPL